MDVFFSALELSPYVATGPTAASVASLAKALANLGTSVTIAVPLAPGYQEAGLLLARRLTPLDLDGETALVFDVQLPTGIDLILVDVGGPLPSSTGPLGAAEAARASLFARAVVRLVADRIESGRPPDVVHAHDALAGLCLVELGKARVRGVGKVLAVHDARVGAEVPRSLASALHLPEDPAGLSPFLAGDDLSLVKGELGHADRVFAPSVSYAKALCSPERMGGLARSFADSRLAGIQDGVDVAVYNPATDAQLTTRYDAADPGRKGIDKTAILRQLELDLALDRPLVLLDSFGGEEQGLGTLFGALPELMEQGVLLVVSGFGAPLADQEKALEHFRGRIAWVPEVTSERRRELLAGADFYLSLRRQDPAGSALASAARYGAIPLAHAVDAAVDLVVDADAELQTGTGFLFDSLSQRALIGAVGRAVAAFRKPRFEALRKRVMRQDLSWDRPARRYLLAYRDISAGLLRSYPPAAL